MPYCFSYYDTHNMKRNKRPEEENMGKKKLHFSFLRRVQRLRLTVKRLLVQTQVKGAESASLFNLYSY